MNSSDVDSSSTTSSSSSSSSPQGSSKSVFKEANKSDSLFRVYADDSSVTINPEGIEALCFDLEVHHTDIKILMLAWKMEAKRRGYFTLEEWRRGLKALHVNTITGIKIALTELEKVVVRPLNFEEFYSFAFWYRFTEEGMQKFIDIERACELLDLILGFRYHPQATKLVEYLKHQRRYNVINLDQWSSFLRFCIEINFPSLDNYDSSSAWPLILDDFVAWMHEKRSELILLA